MKEIEDTGFFTRLQAASKDCRRLNMTTMRIGERRRNWLAFLKLSHVSGGCMSLSVLLFFTACTTTTETTSLPRRQLDPPRGFFEKLMDEMTERECNVGKFSCSYGLGPAGESCDCTDPSGIVLKGRTVK